MDKPKVVVFCGSSKFVGIMAVAAWLVEREEKAISMGLHLLPNWYRSPNGVLPADHLAEHEGVANEMDELHKRKIDLADEIFVINFKDYIGSSTKSEIEYAMNSGKKIRWYSVDYIGLEVDEIIRSAIEREACADPAIIDDHRQDLSCWFGLSYASWLTLPRVLMEAMPEEWQKKMAKLLNEYNEEFPNQPDLETRVQVLQGNKLIKAPDWLLNYRRPDKEEIQRLREKNK